MIVSNYHDIYKSQFSSSWLKEKLEKLLFEYIEPVVVGLLFGNEWLNFGSVEVLQP